MTYLPGGRINATIGGNTDGVGALLSTGTVMFAGGNNITLSQNGNTVTISGAAGGGTQSIGMSNLGNTVGTTGMATGSAIRFALAGGNNVTLSQSINGASGTITISAFNQTVQTQSLIAGVYDGANSISTGTIRFSNSNGVGFGINGQTITASHNGITSQTNQTVGLYGLGNTTQNSSTTLDARTLSLNGLGGVSVGYSNGSIQISGPQTAAQTNQTVGLFGLGNTTQNSSTTRDARSLSFNGLGGITVGYSNGSIQLSGPQTAAQTNQTVGLYALGNTTQNSSTTLDARTLSFNGLGGATVGYSNGSIQISAPTTAAQTNQTVGLYAVGNTSGQSSSSTVDARSLSFNGAGIASVGYSGGSVMISVPAGGGAAGTNTLGMSNLGNTSGTTGMVTGSALQFAFAGGNNVTLSQSINASSATITISAGGGGGGIALANSEATYNTGTVNLLEGGGAITIATSAGGQSFKVSVPATSSLSATGLLSISTNGSTISIGVPYDTMDFYQNMDRGTSASLATAHGTLMLQRLNQENNKFAANITANTLLMNMTVNMTATSLSSSHSMSAYVAIYSDNATVLNLINSASSSWAIGAATGNTASYHGPRWLSFVSSQWSSAPVFTQGGDYVFGVFFRSSNYNPPMSYIGQNYMASAQRSGTMGTSVATNVSLAQGNYWNAMYATSTTAFPAAISSHQVNRNNATAIFIPHIILNNRYSGTF